jgi:dihydrofolate synthase/folylpolyglutamate synthase
VTSDSGTPDDQWREFCDKLGAQAKFGGEFGLGPIQRALEAEGHPERTHPALVVAGTNGKGGTASYLAGILQAHGLSVGLYTSPHLIDLAERFRVGGRPVSRELLLRIGRNVVERYAPDSNNTPDLSYFELTTLIAAKSFEARGVDIAVYEVGLGGRYDAVNAIDPALSIITNVDRDHTDYLGDTIEEIAREKAGVARADRPLVIGRQDHDAAVTTLTDGTPAAPIHLYGRDFDGSLVDEAFRQGGGEAPEGCDDVPWTKRVNAAAACRAAELFLDNDFQRRLAHDGIRRARWPGRFDWRKMRRSQTDLARELHVLFDAAHNPGAVEALFDQLPGWRDQFGAVVCGGMADKSLEQMFGRLEEGPPVWGVMLSSERAADTARLTEAIPEGVCREVGESRQMLQNAMRHCTEQGGHLLVFGSVYLVGACFSAIGLAADDMTTYRDSA